MSKKAQTTPVLIIGKSIDKDFKELINGILYIPLLGDLFPRLWGDRRLVTRPRFLLHLSSSQVEVTEEEYHQAPIGGTFDPISRAIGQ